MAVRLFPDTPASRDTRASSIDLPWADRVVEAFQFLRRLFHCLMTFDVLYLSYYPAASFAIVIMPAILLAKFLGKKVVLDYRSPLLLNRVGNKTYVYRKLWKLCDRVLVPSEYQRQFVNSFGGRADYLPVTAPLKGITARVINVIQPRILVATDLEREHNVVCAIRAFRLIKQKYPRTEMVIAGCGSQKAGLELMVDSEKTSGVTFAGDVSRDQRRVLLENSEIFVNCSAVDYLSVAMVEAFAHGLPVLTTPITGVADVLRGSGNVVLLSYSDHVGLADKIIKLIEEPSFTEKLSRSSRETAEKYCDWAVQPRSRGLYRRLRAQQG